MPGILLCSRAAGAYTVTRPQGYTPRADDCISHIALPSMLLHICPHSNASN